ncbi:toxin-antitoxin system protein [Aquabacterium soli]|uniref:Toxin-antitoxin system protein n=1 Tax=Aquabacterium soli TaxID=2493092 RepID=A0A3R8S5E2_9BURK|nr:toxin-antitoxin system protein [Aquabacterium soli]RRS06409.1 toxin-antitoxin system protein [Aquabacterium soli]
MTMRRAFHGTPVNRLIVSVPLPDVEAVDSLLSTRGGKHPANGCRAEFIRLAIAEKLSRDLMIKAVPKRGP